MIVIVTKIHSSLIVVHCLDKGYVGKQPVAWEEYCAEYWLKELQESMNRCTGPCDITESLLKMAFNTIQSFNKSLIPSQTTKFWTTLWEKKKLLDAYCNQFLLFPQCFQQTCTADTSKPGPLW